MRTPPRIRPLAQSRRSPFGGGRVPLQLAGIYQGAVRLLGLSKNTAFLFALSGRGGQ